MTTDHVYIDLAQLFPVDDAPTLPYGDVAAGDDSPTIAYPQGEMADVDAEIRSNPSFREELEEIKCDEDMPDLVCARHSAPGSPCYCPTSPSYSPTSPRYVPSPIPESLRYPSYICESPLLCVPDSPPYVPGPLEDDVPMSPQASSDEDDVVTSDTDEEGPLPRDYKTRAWYYAPVAEPPSSLEYTVASIMDTYSFPTPQSVVDRIDTVERRMEKKAAKRKRNYKAGVPNRKRKYKTKKSLIFAGMSILTFFLFSSMCSYSHGNIRWMFRTIILLTSILSY